MRVIASIGIPLAIMFHGGVGALFGVVTARPMWNGGLYPVLFLISALASGGAMLLLVSAIFQDGLRRNRATVLDLGKLVLGLLLLDLLFQVSEITVALYGRVPSEIGGWQAILGGPFWFVFWIWQMGIGVLIPVLILALPTRNNALWVSAAGLLIAVGFLAVRLNIVIPGFAVEEVAGISAAYASPRVTTQYFPSLMEWLVSFGIVGIGLLVFGIGEWFLPIEVCAIQRSFFGRSRACATPQGGS